MIREKLQSRGVGQGGGFRFRGHDVSRLEGFSDAVFAFAVTLLVVSLEVPKTFHDLLAVMRGFAAFGICFTFLVLVWHQHYLFFRRYNLHTLYVVVLNSILLFVVLLYVYPLKFLFVFLIDGIMGIPNQVMVGNKIEQIISVHEISTLIIIYGLGFVAISLTFAAMYVYAYRQRRSLELTPLEEFDTVTTLQERCIDAGVGILSIAIALSGIPSAGGLAGIAYPVFLTPLRTVHGFVRGRRRRKFE